MIRLKDFPREVEVGDDVWAVRFVRRVPGHPDHILGLCDPSEHTLFIRLGQSPADRFETFLHEVLHAIEESYGFRIPHRLIYRLERPIARLLFDNFMATDLPTQKRAQPTARRAPAEQPRSATPGAVRVARRAPAAG